MAGVGAIGKGVLTPKQEQAYSVIQQNQIRNGDGISATPGSGSATPITPTAPAPAPKVPTPAENPYTQTYSQANVSTPPGVAPQTMPAVQSPPAAPMFQPVTAENYKSNPDFMKFLESSAPKPAPTTNALDPLISALAGMLGGGSPYANIGGQLPNTIQQQPPAYQPPQYTPYQPPAAPVAPPQPQALPAVNAAAPTAQGSSDAMFPALTEPAAEAAQQEQRLPMEIPFKPNTPTPLPTTMPLGAGRDAEEFLADFEKLGLGPQGISKKAEGQTDAEYLRALFESGLFS